MAMSFGCSREQAEELVQEMYLKVDRAVKDVSRIMYNENEVNTYYIYITLRNLYLSGHHHNKRPRDVEVNDFNVGKKYDEIINYETENLHNDLIEDISSEVNSWYWYDKKLWNIHFWEMMSMRSIAKATTISLSSIFNTLSNGKAKIKEVCQKNYNRYKESQDETGGSW